MRGSLRWRLEISLGLVTEAEIKDSIHLVSYLRDSLKVCLYLKIRN